MKGLKKDFTDYNGQEENPAGFLSQTELLL
jgi:hypothetical protein